MLPLCLLDEVGLVSAIRKSSLLRPAAAKSDSQPGVLPLLLHSDFLSGCGISPRPSSPGNGCELFGNGFPVVV
jgi:hypothetical protein